MEKHKKSFSNWNRSYIKLLTVLPSFIAAKVFGSARVTIFTFHPHSDGVWEGAFILYQIYTTISIDTR